MTDPTNDSGTSAWNAGSSADAELARLDRSTEPDDPEVAQLVTDIVHTRSEMSVTVEELGDRLDPSNIAQRTGEKVREATLGKVESKVDDMTNAASNLVTNAGDTVQQTGSGVVETIRRNPVPAALAGFGIGWLVLNRQPARSDGPAWMDRRTSGWSSADATSMDGRRVSDAIGDRARDASASVGEAADNASRAARQAVSTIGDSAGDATAAAGQAASSVAWSAQRAYESNPLAVGAIAVAVGAALGLALPASEPERRLMGGTGSQLIDKAEAAVTKPLEDAEVATSR
jgi:ElaB/YqjD/DUF883 family membrane-anchored ribosome-binding protein